MWINGFEYSPPHPPFFGGMAWLTCHKSDDVEWFIVSEI
jgi:hypothetical protein